MWFLTSTIDQPYNCLMQFGCLVGGGFGQGLLPQQTLVEAAVCVVVFIAGVVCVLLFGVPPGAA